MILSGQQKQTNSGRQFNQFPAKISTYMTLKIKTKTVQERIIPKKQMQKTQTKTI